MSDKRTTGKKNLSSGILEKLLFCLLELKKLNILTSVRDKRYMSEVSKVRLKKNVQYIFGEMSLLVHGSISHLFYTKRIYFYEQTSMVMKIKEKKISPVWYHLDRK